MDTFSLCDDIASMYSVLIREASAVTKRSLEEITLRINQHGPGGDCQEVDSDWIAQSILSLFELAATGDLLDADFVPSAEGCKVTNNGINASPTKVDLQSTNLVGLCKVLCEDDMAHALIVKCSFELLNPLVELSCDLPFEHSEANHSTGGATLNKEAEWEETRKRNAISAVHAIFLMVGKLGVPSEVVLAAAEALELVTSRISSMLEHNDQLASESEGESEALNDPVNENVNGRMVLNERIRACRHAGDNLMIALFTSLTRMRPRQRWSSTVDVLRSMTQWVQFIFKERIPSFRLHQLCLLNLNGKKQELLRMHEHSSANHSFASVCNQDESEDGEYSWENVLPTLISVRTICEYWVGRENCLPVSNVDESTAKRHLESTDRVFHWFTGIIATVFRELPMLDDTNSKPLAAECACEDISTTLDTTRIDDSDSVCATTCRVHADKCAYVCFSSIRVVFDIASTIKALKVTDTSNHSCRESQHEGEYENNVLVYNNDENSITEGEAYAEYVYQCYSNRFSCTSTDGCPRGKGIVHIPNPDLWQCMAYIRVIFEHQSNYSMQVGLQFLAQCLVHKTDLPKVVYKSTKGTELLDNISAVCDVLLSNATQCENEEMRNELVKFVGVVLSRLDCNIRVLVCRAGVNHAMNEIESIAHDVRKIVRLRAGIWDKVCTFYLFVLKKDMTSSNCGESTNGCTDRSTLVHSCYHVRLAIMHQIWERVLRSLVGEDKTIHEEKHSTRSLDPTNDAMGRASTAKKAKETILGRYESIATSLNLLATYFINLEGSRQCALDVKIRENIPLSCTDIPANSGYTCIRTLPLTEQTVVYNHALLNDSECDVVAQLANTTLPEVKAAVESSLVGGEELDSDGEDTTTAITSGVPDFAMRMKVKEVLGSKYPFPGSC
eukprot:CFRG2405T1